MSGFTIEFALNAPLTHGRYEVAIDAWAQTVLEGDSIFSIAAKLGRGVCDITRANRMMDAEYLFPGFSLIMPDAARNPGNDTCVVQAQNVTATCIYGGRLDYTTATNDTISRVALYKLSITVGSLWTENAEKSSVCLRQTRSCQLTRISMSPNVRAVFSPLQHLNSPTACSRTPEEKYGTTVGQIITLNFRHHYSSAVGTAADEALGLSYPSPNL
ncbi:hypothetical protein GB937_001380 [Aspergillus fischeri]|nr:hypothetical protein GB937_001380 [Aspergillus fischeri]